MGATRRTTDDALYALRRSRYLARREHILAVAKQTYQRQKAAKTAAMREVTRQAKLARLREKRRALYGTTFETAAPRHGSTKEYVNDIKRSNPCLDCNQRFDPCQMDFDHVRGIKTRDVSDCVDTYSIARVKTEIAKCDLICANCHRLRTFHRKKNL